MADDIFTHQGKHIDRMELTVRGMNSLPCSNAKGDVPLQIDDVVNLRVEGRVSGSRFEVDKEGHLVETFVIKPIDTSFQPWDPADPTDDGVSRWNLRSNGPTP